MGTVAEELRRKTDELMKLQRQTGLGSTSTPDSQLPAMEIYDERGKFQYAVVDENIVVNRVQAWILAGYQRLKELGVKANWGERKFTKQGKRFARIIPDDH